MEQPKVIDLRNLLEMITQESKLRGPKVTIYFSVPPSSDYAIIGHAELKGHIHTVTAWFEEIETPGEIRKIILDSLHSLLDSQELWKHRSESYSIFASPSMLRWYALPLPVRDEAHIGNDFYLTPLIHLISLPEQYYLLEVSRGTPRMAHVHPQFTTPILLDQVSALDAALAQENVVHDRAFHTASSGSHAGVSGNGHHGTIPDGGSQDGEFRRREHFLKQLAGVVNDTLKQSYSPLVVTGADELVSHFRKYLHYPNILISPKRIPIPEGDPLTLDTSTWRECTKLFSEMEIKHSVVEDQVEYLRSEGRVTEDLDAILTLSGSGGIMTLMVNDSAVTLENQDLVEPDRINTALVRTLEHHGNVISSNTHKSPTGVTALLRAGITNA